MKRFCNLQSASHLLRRLHAEHRMTVLFVTHSIAEAAYLAERAIVLSSRPARVLCDHRLELPAVRTVELRAEASFAHELGVLGRALARSGA